MGILSKEKNSLPKMKTFITIVVLLAIAQVALSAAAACPAASFCQSCAGGATACSSCYTLGVGTNKDKVWATSTSTSCTGALPAIWKVTNCFINNISSATVINAASTTLGTNYQSRCGFCDGQKFFNKVDNGTAQSCSDTAPSGMTTCVEIANCWQTVCNSAATVLTYCAACQYDTYPTYSTSGTTSGYITSCSTTVPSTAIANCTSHSGSVAGTTVTRSCGGCKTGYAVASTGLTCIAHTGTNSEGCLSLDADGVSCTTCWHAYYFSTSVCILKSFVGALAGAVAFVTLLLLQ